MTYLKIIDERGPSENLSNLKSLSSFFKWPLTGETSHGMTAFRFFFQDALNVKRLQNQIFWSVRVRNGGKKKYLSSPKSLARITTHNIIQMHTQTLTDTPTHLMNTYHEYRILKFEK